MEYMVGVHKQINWSFGRLFIFGGFILAIKQKQNKIVKSLLAFGLILLTFFQAWVGINGCCH